MQHSPKSSRVRLLLAIEQGLLQIVIFSSSTRQSFMWTNRHNNIYYYDVPLVHQCTVKENCYPNRYSIVFVKQVNQFDASSQIIDSIVLECTLRLTMHEDMYTPPLLIIKQ